MYATSTCRTAFALCTALVLAGCGSGESYAPVSGIVTLNGEPLADAKLIFEPVGDETGTGSGKPSYGRTDDSGRYTLTCPIAEEEGAAVGEHRVRIVTMKATEYTPEQMESARQTLQKQEAAGGSNAQITDDQVKEYLSDRIIVATRKEMLPAKYNSETTLTVTVPSGGTDSADFALETN